MLWGLTVQAFSGCAHFTLPRVVDDCLIQARHKHLAKCAWLDRRDCYAGLQPHLCDFKSGFKDGYLAGIAGQTECPPALPPERYWGACYQSRDGGLKAAAWHDGWAHGAIAAEQDNVSNLGQIQLRCPCEPCSNGGGVQQGGYSSDGQPLNGYEPATHTLLNPPVREADGPTLLVPPELESLPMPSNGGPTELYNPPVQQDERAEQKALLPLLELTPAPDASA